MPVMSNTIISSTLIATLIITRKFPQLFFCNRQQLFLLLLLCVIKYSNHIDYRNFLHPLRWKIRDRLNKLNEWCLIAVVVVASFLFYKRMREKKHSKESVSRNRDANETKSFFFLRDYRLLWKSLKKICFYFLLCKKNQQKVNIEN